MSDRFDLLRDNPAFVKLLALCKEKYRSLGKVSGSIDLSGFDAQEIEAIAGLLGYAVNDISKRKKLSVAKIEQSFRATIYQGDHFLALMEAVLQEAIVTKQEAHEIALEKEQRFFQTLRIASPNTNWWWDWLSKKPADARWIWTYYHQDQGMLAEQLIMVAKGFTQLTEKQDNQQFERLPLFAQRLTGNPHALDPQQLAGRLFIYCLQVDQFLKGKRDLGMPKTAEELNQLLGYYQLLKDDLWSFVTCRGFLATDLSGSIHPVWTAAVHTDTVLNVPLKALLKLRAVWPQKGQKVWVVENSSVCSTLLDEVPHMPIVCTHGHFRVASWLLFDLLVQQGCHLYYSGDFDPDGLRMAERLKNRYPDQVTLWRMDVETYQQVLSDEDISRQLAKLKQIKAPSLSALVQVMAEKKLAGYQEGVLARLIEDLTSDMHQLEE